jgi:hypothetical protein
MLSKVITWLSPSTFVWTDWLDDQKRIEGRVACQGKCEGSIHGCVVEPTSVVDATSLNHFSKHLQRDLKVSLVVSPGTCFNVLCIGSFTFSAYLFSEEECLLYDFCVCACVRACNTFKKGSVTTQSVYRWATGWTAWVRFLAWRDFYFLYSTQTGSGAHPASYPMHAGGSSPGAKAAGDCSSPLTSI